MAEHAREYGQRRSSEAVVVLVVDVVESVRAMEANEARFLEQWLAFVDDARERLVPSFGGRVVKSLGDGLLCRFGAAENALLAARAMHEHVDLNGSKVDQLRIRLRAGLHHARVVVDSDDIYGSGVNLAARLSSLAGPGQTIVSMAIRELLQPSVHWRLIDLGECYVKHLVTPTRAFRACPADTLSSEDVGPTWDDEMWVTIAVTSFSALGVDRTFAGIDEALVESLSRSLGSCPGLRVISRVSALAIPRGKGRYEHLRRKLGAAYVVCGRMEPDGDGIRVTTDMISTRSGALAWSDRATVRVENLLGGNDVGMEHLTRSICRALLRTETIRAASLPFPTLDSYTLHVGGVAMLQEMQGPEFDRALSVFEQLSERYPRAATPLAMSALWYLYRTLQGASPDPDGDSRFSLGLASKALELEPNNALALAIAGSLHAHTDGNLDRARRYAERAVVADPQEPQAWLTLASIDSYEALGDACTAHAERSIALSPLDPGRYVFELMMAAGHLVAGRVEESLRWASSSRRANPLHAPTYRLLVIANDIAGNQEAARLEAQALLRIDPGFRVSHFERRYPGRHHSHASRYVRALQNSGIPID